MKYCLVILLSVISVFANAQSKETAQVLARTKLLEQTVFGTKDSLTLEGLFAKSMTYGHSSGKIETREEAIKNIVKNKSVYTEPITADYDTKNNGDSIVTTHVFKSMETKADGTQSILNISIELVWAKEQKKWKVFRRQATKIQ